jgi:hypothetical protein
MFSQQAENGLRFHRRARKSCSYLRDRLASLVQTPVFVDALTGHLPGDRASQDRLPDLEDRLRALSELQ